MSENKYSIKQAIGISRLVIDKIGKNKHIIYFNTLCYSNDGYDILLTNKYKRNILHKAKVYYSNNQRINNTNNLDLKRMFYEAFTFSSQPRTTLARVYYKCDNYDSKYYNLNFSFRVHIVIRRDEKLIDIGYNEIASSFNGRSYNYKVNNYNVNNYKFKLTPKIIEECHNEKCLSVNLDSSFTPIIDKKAWEITSILKFPYYARARNDCKNFIMAIPKINKINKIENMYLYNIAALSSLRPDNFKYLKEISVEIQSLYGDGKKNIYIILRHLVKLGIEKVELIIGPRDEPYREIFESKYLSKIRKNLKRCSYIDGDII